MLPLLAVALVVAGVLAVGITRTAAVAADRAHAQTAADAAALAGAAEGRAAARDLAERNGARLVTYRQNGSEVEVVVQLGVATARARAARIASDGVPVSAPAPPASSSSTWP